jgi:hypothetical protein
LSGRCRPTGFDQELGRHPTDVALRVPDVLPRPSLGLNIHTDDDHLGAVGPRLELIGHGWRPTEVDALSFSVPD